MINVDDIATDQDLVDRYPGVVDVQPQSEARDRMRATALRQIESWLAQRRPRVLLEHLEDVTELRDAVVLRTLALLTRSAVTQEGDLFYVMSKMFASEFSAEIDRSYTVAGGAQSPPRTISLWRG